jgi:hypothetical protein
MRKIAKKMRGEAGTGAIKWRSEGKGIVEIDANVSEIGKNVEKDVKRSVSNKNIFFV